LRESGTSDLPLTTADVFLAMLRRDLRVARRELPFFLLRTALQPLMLMIVFGYLLPKMGTLPKSYTATLLPGVAALSITLSAIQSIALPMVAQFGFSKEIEDRLLAPIPIPLIAAEKVIMGAIQGVLATLVVLPLARIVMGPIPELTFAHFGVILGVTILGAMSFSAAGLWMGATISPQQIGLMFSIIIAPMIFLGCAYYPWQGLDAVPFVKYAVLLNPLVYVAEGMRAALTPNVPHMNLIAIVAALVTIHSLFWLLGMRRFQKRAIG
jgi:ABC-2 type transport system permease protein